MRGRNEVPAAISPQNFIDIQLRRWNFDETFGRDPMIRGPSNDPNCSKSYFFTVNIPENFEIYNFLKSRRESKILA